MNIMQRNNRGLWVALGLLALLLFAGPMVGGGMGMMGGWGMHGWYGAAPANGWLWGLGMGLGWLLMLAFWAAIIALVILAVRHLGGERVDDSALATLRRRYAAGELTREQFEQMRQVLEGSAP